MKVEWVWLECGDHIGIGNGDISGAKNNKNKNKKKNEKKNNNNNNSNNSNNSNTSNNSNNNNNNNNNNSNNNNNNSKQQVTSNKQHTTYNKQQTSNNKHRHHHHQQQQQQQQQQQHQQQSYICVNLIQFIFPHSSEHPLKSKPANGHQPKPPINRFARRGGFKPMSIKHTNELDIIGESPSISENEMFETNNCTKCRLNQSILHKHATQRKQQDKASKIARAPGPPFCSSYWPFPNHCQLNLALGTEIVELDWNRCEGIGSDTPGESTHVIIHILIMTFPLLPKGFARWMSPWLITLF